MTDEKADAILAALEALTEQVRGLRADLAPKPSATINTAPWMPGQQWEAGWTCSQCHAFVSMGASHSCPDNGYKQPVDRWASTAAGTNQA